MFKFLQDYLFEDNTCMLTSQFDQYLSLSIDVRYIFYKINVLKFSCLFYNAS